MYSPLVFLNCNGSRNWALPISGKWHGTLTTPLLPALHITYTLTGEGKRASPSTRTGLCCARTSSVHSHRSSDGLRSNLRHRLESAHGLAEALERARMSWRRGGVPNMSSVGLRPVNPTDPVRSRCTAISWPRQLFRSSGSAGMISLVKASCDRRPISRDLELGMLLPGMKINTTPSDYYPIKQMQMGRFNGEYTELFGPIFWRSNNCFPAQQT
jgi:hypothetical protein